MLNIEHFLLMRSNQGSAFYEEQQCSQWHDACTHTFPTTGSASQICLKRNKLETATPKFEIGDNTFAEHFVVMKRLTGPKIGLHFMRNNIVVIDTTHGLIHFPHLTMQVKTASSETTTKPQPVISDDSLTIPPTTKTITAFVDHPSKWNTTGTVTPLEKFTETASLLISHSISTIIHKKIAVRVTITTESPYLIKKHTQIAEFSIVTPEQSKHIEPVDMAILSMIPQGEPDLDFYRNELLRANEPEPENN